MKQIVFLSFVFFLFSCDRNLKIKEFQKGGDVFNFETYQFKRNYADSAKTINLFLSKEELELIEKKISKYRVNSIEPSDISLIPNVNISGEGYFIRFDEKQLFVELIHSEYYQKNEKYINLSKFIGLLDSIIYRKEEVLELPSAQ
ncbi:hypothetical protein [Moheibacter sp.]|uniref:hypothetical protein n=1 Tax=Moheibacter sp. TaxID=1965316 RepID=UPI003C78AE59